MDRIDITLTLPQDLVERAKQAGLLSDEQVERWLNEELARQAKLERFFNTLDQLQAIEPPLTMEEINAEVAAHREEKHQQDTDS